MQLCTEYELQFKTTSQFWFVKMFITILNYNFYKILDIEANLQNLINIRSKRATKNIINGGSNLALSPYLYLAFHFLVQLFKNLQNQNDQRQVLDKKKVTIYICLSLSVTTGSDKFYKALPINSCGCLLTSRTSGKKHWIAQFTVILGKGYYPHSTLLNSSFSHGLTAINHRD